MRRPSEIVSFVSVHLGELSNRLEDRIVEFETEIWKNPNKGSLKYREYAAIIGAPVFAVASFLIDLFVVNPLWSLEDKYLGKKPFDEIYMVQRGHYDGPFHSHYSTH